MRYFILLMTLCLMAGCESTAAGGKVSTSARPAMDLARDPGRQPFAVLDYLGVEAGMTTMDVMAAGGYYTEVLAQRVGANGIVYAQNPAVMLRFGGGRNDRALTRRLLNDRLPNVRRLDREFNDLGLVAGSVDIALTALNFHDIYNNNPSAAAGVLRVVHVLLKPGGVLGIIDHVGNPGADNKTLHRIDPALVVAAAEAAGFGIERSDLLANENDDHTQKPFVPALRGATDRFVLKLTKQ